MNLPLKSQPILKLRQHCADASNVPQYWITLSIFRSHHDHLRGASHLERAYDYGNRQMSWLCNLFTNRIGDDGFLLKKSGDERAFNMMGGTTILEGKVVKKYIEGEKCCADIEAWAKNQRGENSMPPNMSTVI